MHGAESVVLSDIVRPDDELLQKGRSGENTNQEKGTFGLRAPSILTMKGPFLFADVLDFKCLQEIVVNHRIDWLVHFRYTHYQI